MTTIFFLVFRTFFITMMTVGMMASLTTFRFRRRTLFLILAAYSFWVIISSVVLLWLGGELLLLRLFYLTISVPATVLTYWAANDTPVQAVFNYMTQILMSLLLVASVRLLTVSWGLSGLTNILLMGVLYGVVIYLEWRFLRQPFRRLIQMIPARWGVLTLIPSVFCIYFIFVASWPGSYLENHVQVVYIYAAVLPLIVVYVAVFKSLYDLYCIQMEQHSAALLSVQIMALKEKVQSVKEIEEEIRVQRHDLRHRLQVVKGLVARGDQETALNFLDAAENRLDVKKNLRWCGPPVLDAVFAYYFEQAQKLSIRLETRISMPDTLAVDEGELALVLANALENAIHANMDMPESQREIRCKMVGYPSIMLDISNPCLGNVAFDSNGLPIAQKEGHGLGVQSIAAFCRKHGAVCQFEMADGWFRLRLVL